MRHLLERRSILEGAAYFNVDTQRCDAYSRQGLFEARSLLEEIQFLKFKDKVFELFEAPNQHNSYDFVLWKNLPLVISIFSE